MFAREREVIQSALAALKASVEHIGSTSVPGLPAKPKIDILVGLQSWDDLDPAVDVLLQAGYEHEAQLLVLRHFSVKRGHPTTHRVHLVEHDSDQWTQLLTFRDALRADPELAARYGELKQELARFHPDDHQAYSEGKGAFIERVLRGDSMNVHDAHDQR